MMDILEIRNVSKQYDRHIALDDVSMNVPEACIFGLLGPNGAGKTSLIRIITRITAADTGTIRFKGEELKADHSTRIGYLPEERGLYKKMEVGEQLLYFARLKGLGRHEANQKLKAWVDKFEIRAWWKKKVEELSKGMQQKIQFIATVLHDPELIILDEPFSGFDPINANLITEEILRLKQEGRSIIFSTHRMESVELLCDHIALINKSKKILEGSVKAIRERYRSHTYEVDYVGNPLMTGHEFEVLDTRSLEPGHSRSLLRASSEQPPNNLLKSLIGKVEVHRFEEQLPDMQRIFIDVVTGSRS